MVIVVLIKNSSRGDARRPTGILMVIVVRLRMPFRGATERATSRNRDVHDDIDSGELSRYRKASDRPEP